MCDEVTKENKFVAVIIMTHLSRHGGEVEHEGMGFPGKNVNVSSLLYLLHVLKHTGRMGAVYCFTDDAETKAVAEEYGCKGISFVKSNLMIADMDDLISVCLKRLEHEVGDLDPVLLINNAADAFVRFPLDAFLSVFDSDTHALAFSAEKETETIWKMPVFADQEGTDTACAEPVHALQNPFIHVRETGEVYAFSAKALQKQKKRFLMRAKPIMPLALRSHLCIKGRDEKIRPDFSDMQSLSENVMDILTAVRELDGVVKSFILSYAAVKPKIDISSFPNGVQKFLIFFYAPFVWIVGGKYHYDRLKKDPAAFFIVTQDAFNLFFLKILYFFGPNPRR